MIRCDSTIGVYKDQEREKEQKEKKEEEKNRAEYRRMKQHTSQLTSVFRFCQPD